MKAFKAIALGGLVLTTVAPIMMFTGAIDLDTNKTLMLIGMIVWFIGATPWLGSNKPAGSDSKSDL
jgi:hypothetical protein